MRPRQWAFLGMIGIVSILSGCGEFVVSPRYVSQDIVDPEISQVAAIKLVVRDERMDKDVVGVTEDTYKRPIRLNRPAPQIMEEGFRQALTETNWVVSETAEFTCQVTLLEVKLVWSAKFSSNFEARVSLNVAVLNKGRHLGVRRVTEQGWQANKLTSNKELEGGHCLSVVLSRAIDKAVSDKSLFALLRATNQQKQSPSN